MLSCFKKIQECQIHGKVEVKQVFVYWYLLMFFLTSAQVFKCIQSKNTLIADDFCAVTIH